MNGYPCMLPQMLTEQAVSMDLVLCSTSVKTLEMMMCHFIMKPSGQLESHQTGLVVSPSLTVIYTIQTKCSFIQDINMLLLRKRVCTIIG